MENEMTAYEHGMAAYKDGLPMTANPFDPKSLSGSAWLNGYAQAEHNFEVYGK